LVVVTYSILSGKILSKIQIRFQNFLSTTNQQLSDVLGRLGLIKINNTIDKEFTKEYINVEDNLLATEQNVLQSALIQDPKKANDPKENRKLNEAYLKMFVDMFGGQFKVEDLKQADITILKTLEKIYLAALGIKEEVIEELDGEDEKKG